MALEEEETTEPDLEVLNQLRQIASRESAYFDLPPDRRKAYNIFFGEVRDMFMAELLAGNYGASILLDQFFILCFESGYTLSAIEEQKERRGG
jgi:hypothetical protein